MLVVSAGSGVVAMTEELLGIATALEVPFFVMVTKVDVAGKEKLQATLNSLEAILKSIGTKKVRLKSITPLS